MGLLSARIGSIIAFKEAPSMNFIFPCLFWRRKAKKQEEKNAKIFAELGNMKVLAELAGDDPKTLEALHTLGIKIPPQ